MTVVHRIEHPPRVTEQLSLMKKTCKHCGIVISRSPDMIRHCMRHLSKEDRIKLMQFCSFPGCSFSTLQSSNLKNHERKHTNKQRCCDAIIIKKDGGTERCTFSTQDNGSLTNHKKSVHGQGAKYAPRDKRGAQRGQRKVFITPTSHPERSLRGCSSKQRSTRSDPLASVYVQDVVPSYSGTANTPYDVRLRADPHRNHFSPIFPTDQAHRQLTGTQFGDLGFVEFASPQPSSPIAIPDYYRDSALGGPVFMESMLARSQQSSSPQTLQDNPWLYALSSLSHPVATARATLPSVQETAFPHYRDQFGRIRFLRSASQ